MYVSVSILKIINMCNVGSCNAPLFEVGYRILQAQGQIPGLPQRLHRLPSACEQGANLSIDIFFPNHTSLVTA